MISYAIHIQHFMSDSNSNNNNSYSFGNSQIDINWYVWEEEIFCNNDNWEIKLLSEFQCNSDSTFYDWH